MRAAFDRTRDRRTVGDNPNARADLADVIREAGGNPDTEMLDVLERAEAEDFAQDIELFDDSLPVLRELRARSIPTALVSNCSHNTAPVTRRLRLAEELDVVILSFEVRAKKPESEIYRIALERLGGPEPASTWFVDDKAIYCDGAAAIGLRTRWLRRPERQPPRPAGVSPDPRHTVISSLTDVLDEIVTG